MLAFVRSLFSSSYMLYLYYVYAQNSNRVSFPTLTHELMHYFSIISHSMHFFIITIRSCDDIQNSNRSSSFCQLVLSGHQLCFPCHIFLSNGNTVPIKALQTSIKEKRIKAPHKHQWHCFLYSILPLRADQELSIKTNIIDCKRAHVN